MKSKFTAPNFLKILFIALSLIGSACFAQDMPPLDPISRHYKTLAEVSSAPNPARAKMDSIVFSWEDYSTKSLMAKFVPVYLNPEDSARLHTLIRFPANSSDQTRAELDYLLKLQETRTPEQVKRSEFIANSLPETTSPLANGTLGFFYSAPVGSWLTPENFPALKQLIENCAHDIRLTEFFLKRVFKRSRPYHLEPNLKPITQIGTPAFPSGHTLWAFSEAHVFSEIIPEKRKEFLKLAEEVRWSREIFGIHFPSDNEAARVIAWNLVESWHHNSKFMSDLEKAKAEWKEKSRQYEQKK